jgi:NosR/NirI family nitrous oxide reductase transcriptional regulator
LSPLLATARFPPPEFSETGHVLPTLAGPAARALSLELLDVAVLVVALALAAWLSLRARSRRGLVWLGLFSLLYFGFWRQGCICSIGSIQNVAQALFDPSYAVPLSVLAFAVLPLLAALFFGRAFCAGVCPHGALQDLMLIKPIQLPTWLERSLRLLAYAYLGLALIFAATGGGYLICAYDPFVPLFRLGGSPAMVTTGIVLLGLGLFVGRPYCRFLCPYGVLLGFAARVSRWRVTVTPDTCTQCRLCEQACPFGALTPATLDARPRNLISDKRRLALLFVLLPLVISAGVWLGGLSAEAMARRHRLVSLSERIHLEDTAVVADRTDASAAFRALGEPAETLHAEARTLRGRYTLAGRLGGGWVGLVLGVTLISQSVRRHRRDYEADRMDCLSCARCFKSCPQELQRLGVPVTIHPRPGSA